MNITEANKLIKYTSEVFDKQISDRGLLESQLFPVTAYICVSFYNAYDMLYDVLKKVSEKTTPERMGKESRKILSELQTLTINYIPLYYMEGRMGEIHHMGGDPKNEPEEKRKETLFILDFWKRLASSYYPSGKIFVSGDEENTNYALNRPDIDWTIKHLQETDSQQVKKIKRTLANLEVVSFLDECEARAKLCDHGPYKINDNEILVFREISHLYDGGDPHFPWSGTKAKSPHSNIAFALRLKNVKAEFDNFATMSTNPKTFTEHITGATLITRKGEKLYPLNFDVLDKFNNYANQAQKELYIKFSKWNRRERLIAGAYAYCYGYARYTNFVGITNEIDWDLTERTMEKYIPYFMENDFDPAISRHLELQGKRSVRDHPYIYSLRNKYESKL